MNCLPTVSMRKAFEPFTTGCVAALRPSSDVDLGLEWSDLPSLKPDV